MTATGLANLFVSKAKQVEQRIGYRKGNVYGNPNGAIPFDTGALQNSIRVTVKGKNVAQVTIGSGDIFYAEFLEFASQLKNGNPNLHKGFIEKFCLEVLAPAIEKKYKCKVDVSFLGGNNDK